MLCEVLRCFYEFIVFVVCRFVLRCVYDCLVCLCAVLVIVLYDGLVVLGMMLLCFYMCVFGVLCDCIAFCVCCYCVVCVIVLCV